MDAETQNGEEQLAQLRKEERSLSVRRTRLHNRLDFLRAGGYPGQSNETIADLERQEQEISRQRLEVHERIELAEARLARHTT